MSAFPTLSTSYTYASRLQSLQDRKVRRGTDGSARIRTLWAGLNGISVVYEYLTTSDKAAVEAHFAANAGNSFDFDWDGVTYTVCYADQPFAWDPQPGSRWKLELQLEESSAAGAPAISPGPAGTTVVLFREMADYTALDAVSSPAANAQFFVASDGQRYHYDTVRGEWDLVATAPRDVYVDIRAAGARPGTGHENTAALQAAFTAAASAGVPVYVPPGDWYYAPTSASLTLSAPIVFHPAARLVCNTTAGDFARIDVNGVSGWYAINPAIYVPNATAQIGETACFFRITSCTYFEVRNLLAENCAGVPLLIRHSLYGKVIGTRMKGCWKDGVHVTGTSDSILVSDTVVRDGGDDGVAVVGYVTGTGAGQPKRITIVGTTINKTKSARGIAVVGGRFVTVQGFTIENAAASGVYVAGEAGFDTYSSEDVLVQGGIITGSGLASSYGALHVSGRSTSDRCKNIRLENIVVQGSRWRAGSFSNGNDITVKGCRFDTNTSGSGVEFNAVLNPRILDSEIIESNGHGLFLGNTCTGIAEIDVMLDNVNASGTSTNDGVNIQSSTQLDLILLRRVRHRTQSHTFNRLIDYGDTDFKLRVGSISAESAAAGGLALGAAQVTDTVTASPYVHTAATQQLCRVNGGTVSLIEISIDGGTTYLGTGKTSGYFRLGANDKLRITYTVAPTVAAHQILQI